MKAFLVPILIILMATQSFSKWLVLLDFNLNRNYIAANLCENRTKPATTCGGKCQLAKALEKDESSPSSPVQSKARFVEVLFPLPAFTTGVAGAVEDKAPLLPYYLFKPYSAPAPAVFHPPA